MVQGRNGGGQQARPTEAVLAAAWTRTGVRASPSTAMASPRTLQPAEGVECLEERPGLEQLDVPELSVQQSQWPGQVESELNLPAQVLLL